MTKLEEAMMNLEAVIEQLRLNNNQTAVNSLEIVRGYLKNPWQPIETAPMGGQPIYVIGADEAVLRNEPPRQMTPYIPVVVFYGDFLLSDSPHGKVWTRGFRVYHNPVEMVVNPTEWMPLPKPPEEGEMK